MHQLKAIIWKSYKVRIRSPYSTALDLLGPVILIALYVAVKFLMNQTALPELEDQTRDMRYFRNVQEPALNVRQDLGRHMCPRVLYFSSGGVQSATIETTLKDECGLELVKTASRLSLVQTLRRGLDERMHYFKEGVNLNKLNSTNNNNCITQLAQRDGSEFLYQTGLVHLDGNNIEIHSTEYGTSSVLHMPYSQGSPYNEHRLPHSDLNLGIHLVELCIGKAFSKLVTPAIYVNKTLAVNNSSSSGGGGGGRSISTRATIDSVSLRFKPYPLVTGIYVVPLITTVVIMLGSLCSSVVVALRISESNEHGLHRYIRVAGLPACYYWIGHQAVVLVQILVQSLLIAILLAIPTGDYISDAISESSMTFRWMLIFIYSLATSTHAILMASLFDRTGQALLVICSLGSMYAMYPLLFILQWTPLGFSSFFPLNYIALFNPVSTFETICQIMVVVSLQENQSFGWTHLSDRIINGGMSRHSTGELLLFLLFQAFLALLLTIVIDQYRYSTANNLFSFAFAFFNELCFSNCCCNSDVDQLTEDVASNKTAALKTAQSKLDPNRICCSLSHVNVRGATVLIPHTRKNLLKFSQNQLRSVQTRQEEDRPISKTTDYLINRKLQQQQQQQKQQAPAKERVEPILLDEAIKQNVVWYSTTVEFRNLELNFRFNQITFVLGQTNLKELLFDCILGLQPLSSGHIIIDGVRYSAATLNLARKQIGYLSEKDIFFNELTIFENLQFFGSIREPAYKSYDSESQYILSLLHLYSRRASMPVYLTHRSARKLALGVASVGHTKLLLLTEPTANLHWRPRCQVYNLLKKYKSIRSIVVDSSDVDETVAFGDRIILLKNGAANLNDTPAKLAQQLACGYWLVFQPASGDGLSINSNSIKSLERLTSNLFQKDKLDLDATKRSIYHKLNRELDGSNPGPGQANPEEVAGGALDDVGSGANDLDQHEDLQRAIIIVKVRHTLQSTRALCTLLKMFATQQQQPGGVHGFRLAHLSYESLEDILVLRMSRAIYPHLPPDLLLSLQHRTQLNQRAQEQSPISVRRLESYTKLASTATLRAGSAKPIFASNLATIVKDRLRARSELVATLTAFAGALTIILIALFCLRQSLGRSVDPHPQTGSPVSPRATRTQQQHPMSLTSGVTYHGGGGGGGRAQSWLRHRGDKRDLIQNFAAYEDKHRRVRRGEFPLGSGFVSNYGEERHVHYKSLPFDIVERLYRYRIGLYILKRGSQGDTGAADNSANEELLSRWNGNSAFFGIIDLTRGKLRNQTDAQIVADLINNSRDLASAIVVYEPATSEAMIIFESYLPHVLMAAVKKFIAFHLTPKKVAVATSAAAAAAAAATTTAGATAAGTRPATTWRASDSRREQTFWNDLNGLPSYKNGDNDDDGDDGLTAPISLERPPVYTTSVHYFHHPWHEMIKGYTSRRMIYGVGFALAESLATGVLVFAPTRHRAESRVARVQTSYWFCMAAFDMTLSLLLILGYILLFVLIEGLYSGPLIAALFIVLLIYKLASLPIPYTVSIATENPVNGFLFIVLIYITISWDFAIMLRAFVEWTLMTNKYIYTISNWILFGLPITALIDSLTVVQQINNINGRCRDVPAYTRTSNTVELDGVRRLSIMNDLFDKVRECLASGKVSVDTDVMHQRNLGILWFIYLIILFGLIGWTFLLTCERFFGILARRFNSARTSADPMETIVRLPDTTGGLFKWDKERDRLISEYIKSMNEIKYVKCMANNCLILRVWLKPMGDQTLLDRRLTSLLEPLFGMGHTKKEIQIELRTTLQIFIRIGDESRRCRVDKIHLIETYTKFAELHTDSIAKIAVVDWTRENLYKIVLHGHYNNKIATAI